MDINSVHRCIWLSTQMSILEWQQWLTAIPPPWWGVNGPNKAQSDIRILSFFWDVRVKTYCMHIIESYTCFIPWSSNCNTTKRSDQVPRCHFPEAFKKWRGVWKKLSETTCHFWNCRHHLGPGHASFLLAPKAENSQGMSLLQVPQRCKVWTFLWRGTWDIRS